MSSMLRRLRAFCIFAAIMSCPAAAQQQADPDFVPLVERPAYTSGEGPVVAIDEAHQNLHTAAGQYRPFAELLRLDGYQIKPSTTSLDSDALNSINILVIANARAPSGGSAFSDEERTAIREWVSAGGSLLLIADHAPFGAAVAPLAETFGIRMGNGFVYVREGPEVTSHIDYSRENGRLGEHPLFEGRDASERVSTVRTFTGQSLTTPPGAVPLLSLPDGSFETPQRIPTGAVAQEALESSGPPANGVFVGGRSQAVAMRFGKGRLVALGEAGMFSAQVMPPPPGAVEGGFKFGMNLPGTDNQQFALNVLHWLSSLIEPE